ncbi:hypothetical protein MNAN1_003441 [Malassezia nana]|uniref:Uncharacterized protein n=1 Tax=Malassezia nana TaxID=180528 RepID=A0AAF0EPT0_9BASI|nr:hypothetical protein MNAN1_003441 [Malassezia nana]
MGPAPILSSPPPLDVSLLCVHPDGVSLSFDANRRGPHAVTQCKADERTAVGLAPKVWVDGRPWTQLEWVQPHILRVHNLAPCSYYDLRVAWDPSDEQPTIQLTPASLAAHEEDNNAETHLQQALQSVERAKAQMDAQEHRLQQRMQALQEQVQRLEAQEEQNEQEMASLEEALTVAQNEAIEYEKTQQEWLHQLQERMTFDTAQAEQEARALHQWQQEAAAVEQAVHDTQNQYAALQDEVTRLEAQLARRHAGVPVWRAWERRPSPLQLHRRTASLRESAHRSLSEGWRPPAPVQPPKRSLSFRFPLAPREDMD